MNTNLSIVVPFYNSELHIVEHNGQPYVPMRSIVQGMGLDWKSQFVKLKQRFSTCVVEITTQILGDDQARSHTCLLLRKLPAWLYSIHANKVKPAIRETVIKYQEECDDVLWDYWTKGKAERQPEQNTAFQLLCAETTNKIMNHYNALYSEIRSLGGTVPGYPKFNKDEIVNANITQWMLGKKFVIEVDHTFTPQIRLVPVDFILSGGNTLVDVIGNSNVTDQSILPEIINTAVKRLSKG